MLQTGSSVGKTGPTIFLVKGKQICAGFDIEFLLRYGVGIGSRIMTNKKLTWIPKHGKQQHQLSLRDTKHTHPCKKPTLEWWILEIIDSFGVHLSS